MIETWYVMEDGTRAHPRDVKRDAQGVLRHKDGRPVAMRGDVPRSRSVNVEAELAKAKSAPAKEPERVVGRRGRQVTAAGDDPGYETR